MILLSYINSVVPTGARGKIDQELSHKQGGRAFRTLNLIDEFTRECLAIRVNRKLNSTDVIDILTDLFVLMSTPE